MVQSKHSIFSIAKTDIDYGVPSKLTKRIFKRILPKATMRTYIHSNQRKEHSLNVEVPVIENRFHRGRALVRKRFVDETTLVIVFILSMIFMAFFTFQMQGIPIYLKILIGVPILFLIWNKLYQTLYDLKLLFFFNEKYDSHKEFPIDKEYPTVAFIIPSYREPFEVAKMTFDSAVNTPYEGKKEIIVVDNSKDVTTSDFIRLRNYVEEFNVLHPTANIDATFVYNNRQDTLKPGNLDLAEQHIKECEYVIILDVDSTLPMKENLLEKAVTEFILDSKLGFIQFRMKATNNHFNNLTQSVAASQDLHRLRLTSRSYGGYKIFEGHNGMWRKTLLNRIGAWTTYYKGNIMITEDAMKSAQVYSKGYYGKSLNIKTGEWVPNSLNALESMWMRWTYGTSQVLFKCFKEIYSKEVSLVEKFDVSHHILHHFACGFILPIAILLQLIVPGLLTNTFIIFMYIIPQLIGAATIYFDSINKLNNHFVEKVMYAYTGFFLVDTFIMSTQLKGSINFLSGVTQGWKVTEKGVEDSLKWKDLLLNKSFHILMACFAFIACGVSWVAHYDMNPTKVTQVLLLGFMGVNLLLCIVLYGKEGRRHHNYVESAVIDEKRVSMS